MILGNWYFENILYLFIYGRKQIQLFKCCMLNTQKPTSNQWIEQIYFFHAKKGLTFVKLCYFWKEKDLFNLIECWFFGHKFYIFIRLDKKDQNIPVVYIIANIQQSTPLWSYFIQIYQNLIYIYLIEEGNQLISYQIVMTFVHWLISHWSSCYRSISFGF